MSKSRNNKKTVVILGAPRSGTSLAAGLLSILGVDMGRDIRQADEFNPKGYFEDLDFSILIMRILMIARENRKFKKWEPSHKDFLIFLDKRRSIFVKDGFPLAKQILTQRRKFTGEIQKFIYRRSKEKFLWGIKFPLASLTMDLFLPHLTKPFFIVILRNPIHSAESLRKYYRIKKIDRDSDNLMPWLNTIIFLNNNILKLVKKYPDLPCIFVSFEDMLADPA